MEMMRTTARKARVMTSGESEDSVCNALLESTYRG